MHKARGEALNTKLNKGNKSWQCHRAGTLLKHVKIWTSILIFSRIRVALLVFLLVNGMLGIEAIEHHELA